MEIVAGCVQFLIIIIIIIVTIIIIITIIIIVTIIIFIIKIIIGNLTSDFGDSKTYTAK